MLGSTFWFTAPWSGQKHQQSRSPRVSATTKEREPMAWRWYRAIGAQCHVGCDGCSHTNNIQLDNPVIGHFEDKTFQAINCTGTEKKHRTESNTCTWNTKKQAQKLAIVKTNILKSPSTTFSHRTEWMYSGTHERIRHWHWHSRIEVFLHQAWIACQWISLFRCSTISM